MQNRCLNVIGLSKDTVESLVTRRQNLTRKEFKRVLESEAHPCKRFLDKAVSRTVSHKQSFIPRGAKRNLT